MIMEAIEYKVVLKRYAEEQLEPSPDDEEWTNSEEMMKSGQILRRLESFLGAFEEATKVFSTHRSPTSHLFLHNVLCIVSIKL
jgi:hypothetical protein